MIYDYGRYLWHEWSWLFYLNFSHLPFINKPFCRKYDPNMLPKVNAK